VTETEEPKDPILATYMVTVSVRGTGNVVVPTNEEIETFVRTLESGVYGVDSNLGLTITARSMRTDK
jgi:hypothetical protein